MKKELSLTRFEWLETLPPDLAAKALQYANKYYEDLVERGRSQLRLDEWRESKHRKLADALAESFPWDDTGEGWEFWSDLTHEVAEEDYTFFKVGEVYDLRGRNTVERIRVTEITSECVKGTFADDSHPRLVYEWHPSGLFFRDGQRSRHDDLIPHDYDYVPPVYAWKKPTTAERALILD